MNNNIIFYTLVAFSSFIILLLLLPFIIKAIKIIWRRTRYSTLGSSSKIRLIRQLQEAVEHLSQTKTGAIITIVNKQAVDQLRTDGVKIDANISSALIMSIFNKNSPLHDGAIIIDNDKITYVGTYYKITSMSLDNKYGARHRAAMGISEQTDALTIIISEETGRVTFAINAQFHHIRLSDFQEKLTAYIS